jgi:hypothetical protein
VTHEQGFTPAQLREDFQFLLDTLEAVHPNLYAFTSSSVIETERIKIEQALSQPTTRRGFYRLVAPLVCPLVDGHTFIHPPYADFHHWIEQGGRIFPFAIVFQNGIARIHSTTWSDWAGAAGAELLAINDIPIGAIVDRLLPYSVGERHVRRLEVLQHAFALLLWCVYEVSNQYVVTVRVNGLVQRQIVSGIAPPEQPPAQSQTSGAEAAPYTYVSLPDERSGLLDFRACVDVERFEMFLQETFSQIRQAGTQSLIIDLRHNDGGTSDLGDALLGFLTDQAVMQYASMDIKASPQVQAYYRQQAEANKERRYFDDVVTAPGGTLLTIAGQPLVIHTNPLRFQGDLYVLIGRSTYSAAVMLAATVKDYRLGVLVGEETGGLATQYADIYPFELPQTHLHGMVSHKRFVRPSGGDDGRGVLPDYWVEAGDAAQGAEKDAIVEYTKELIHARLKRT